MTGRKWTYGIEESVIETFLSEKGFALISHYTPGEPRKRYLNVDNGTTCGRINETHCIALAAVVTVV
jgi:hypothetical protein